jgi:putative oxidoreductase
MYPTPRSGANGAAIDVAHLRALRSCATRDPRARGLPKCEHRRRGARSEGSPRAIDVRRGDGDLHAASRPEPVSRLRRRAGTRSARARSREATMHLERLAQFTYTALRVVSGLLLFQSGAKKMLGWFGGEEGPPPAMTQMWIGGILELVGGALVMVGLLTRPAAFIVSGMMAVAYWQFHAPRGGWPIQNEGAPAVLLCFIFLYVSMQGGGPWSVDAALRKRKHEPTVAPRPA